MFEDSTFASTGKIRMRTRAGFFAAFLFETAAVVALVLIPLLYPQMLPHMVNAILMSAPSAPAPEPKPQSRANPATVAPAVLNVADIQAPSRIPTTIYSPDKPEPPVTWNSGDLIADSRTGNDANPFGSTPPVAIAPPVVQHAVRLPSFMVEGLLIHKTVPVYPPIARAARVQGTVVLQATVARNGVIENLRVANGPPMLQQAALDAVSTWRYRPYMLNGEPIEVETTVNVVFKLEE